MNVKPLKVNVPAMDIDKLAQLMLSMDTNGFVGDVQTAATSVRNSEMRQLFQAMYKNQGLDFTMHDKHSGSYRDPKMEAVYLSFKYALVRHTGALQNAFKRISRNSVERPYIIGMQVSDGTVQFGYRPYKHNTLDKAIAEATKLRDRNNKSYSIFGVVGNVTVDEKKPGTVNTPVEETRQGVGGKLNRSVYKVMTDWENIVKSVDVAKSDIPISIGLTAGGKHRIAYSLSESITVYDTYAECLRHVDNWISEYHKTHPEVKTQPTT